VGEARLKAKRLAQGVVAALARRILAEAPELWLFAWRFAQVTAVNPSNDIAPANVNPQVLPILRGPPKVLDPAAIPRNPANGFVPFARACPHIKLVWVATTDVDSI